MKSQKKKLIFSIVALIAVFAITLASSFAWFMRKTWQVDTKYIGGEVLTNYFHCGIGTEDDPFVVTRPIHYYNLVNLYQRVESYSDNEYYFRLGIELDPDTPNYQEGFVVYDYDDDGKIKLDEDGNPLYSTELNMKFYDGSTDEQTLLPIGTHDRNFLGHFDGEDLVIKNLTVFASAGDVETCCDIGAFGFVGADATVKDLYFEGLTIDLSNVSNVVSNVTSPQTHDADAHIRSGMSVAYAGYIAGHIILSSQFEDVYINDVTLEGANESVCDFGYFGCVENVDQTLTQTLGEAISYQFGSGKDVGWGGTVNMKSMYNRLYSIARSVRNTGNPTYTTAETIIKDRDTGVIINRYVTETGNSIASHRGYDLDLHSYSTPVAGSYTFNTANGYNPWIYLTGANQYQTKTVTIYETYEGTDPAYYICDNEKKNFLSVDSAMNIVNTKSTATATKWMLDSSNRLSAFIGVTRYYLNRNGSSFTLSTTPSSTWTFRYDANNKREIYTTDSGTNYYLTFDDVWKIITTQTKYRMNDGSGHYLSYSGGKITDTASAGAATSFQTNLSGSSVQIWTDDFGSRKYLSYVSGTGLTFTDSSFSWTRTENNGKYSYSYNDNGINWYLGYDDGWKVLMPSGKTVACNDSGVTYYLTANRELDGVTFGSANAYRSLWQIATEGENTTISLLYNGKRYYLAADTGDGSLYLTETKTYWKKDASNKYYVEVSDVPYYLVYKNGWHVETSDKLYLISNGNYLSYNTDDLSVINKTTPTADSSTWNVENVDGDGYITCVIDGTTYYLCADGSGNLWLQTNRNELKEEGAVIATAATKWNKARDGFSTEINGESYYLIYNNGWTLLKVYVEISSDGTYLHYSGNASDGYVVDYATASSDNTRWYYDDDSLWMVKDGTKYYLTFVGENQTPVLSTAENNNWNVSVNPSVAANNYIRTKDGKYYLNWFREKEKVNDSNVTRIIWATHTTESCYMFYAQNNYLYLDSDLYQGRTNDPRFYQAHWRYDTSTHHFYLWYLGQKWFLRAATNASNFPMTTNESQATEWFFDNDILNKGVYFIIAENTRRYIMNDNGYKHDERFSYRFSYGSNYLGMAGTTAAYNIGVANKTAGQDDTIEWQYYPDATDTPIYQVRGGSVYYLTANSSGTLSITSTRTLWHKDSNGYYLNSGQYLGFDALTNTWAAKPMDHEVTIISDGAGNYLSFNGSSFSNTTNKNDAASCEISGTSSNPGKVAINGPNGKVYLKLSGSSLTTTTSNSDATSWTVDKGALSSGGYYLGNYGGTWTVKNNQFCIAYLDGSTYNYMTSTEKTVRINGSNVEGLENTTDKSQAAEFTFSKGGSSPTGTITIGSSKLNGSTNNGLWIDNYSDTWSNDEGRLKGKGSYWLYFDKTNSYWRSNSTWRETAATTVVVKAGAVVSTETVKGVVAPTISMYYYGGNLNSCIQNIGDVSQIGESAFGLNITPANTGGHAESRVAISADLGSVTVTDKTILPYPTETFEEISKNISVNTIDTKAMAFSEPTVIEDQYSGALTYVPLRLELQDEDDDDTYYSDYRVDRRNTGYIVSGSYDETSDYRSDIRVSEYDTSDISRALNSGGAPTFTDTYNRRLQVITRTASSGGYVRIKDKYNENTTSYSSLLPSTQMTVDALGLTKYTSNKEDVSLSRDDFGQMLMGSNDVYGLHFMDSTISKNHLICADRVSILGNTYYNYELPEDSIDFKVYERGSINFFAGTYYSSTVTGFFSLHQIFRDNNNHITDIKEIKKIYKKADGSYVYLFADGTCSDKKYTSSNISVLPLLFDTDWITNPGTLVQNAVYYFEIPVNRGEFALGCVPGKIGAYLMYLDIATNGVGTKEQRVSSIGSGVSSKFSVDFRSRSNKENKLPDGCPSLIQLAVDTPANSKGKFSLNVKFIEDNNEDHPNGLYSITVTNKTNGDLTLVVFVCDNDTDTTNDYPYAFEILVINNTNSEPTPLILDETRYYKTCFEFDIPSSG